MPTTLPLNDDRRAMLMQLFRYGLTGGVLTVISAGIYWALATPWQMAPQMAINAAYAVAVVLGYFFHGRFSFRGHGSSERRSIAQSGRFLAVSFVSLGLNKIWVWMFTGWLAGPPWWAIPAIVFVTPVAVFALNRKWVFA